MSRRAVSVLALGVTLLAAPPVAGAQAQDCAALPTSAQRARACNPQQECLQRAERLTGPAAAAARRDCQRMPTSGTCYGPETYDPQAECLQRQRKK